MICSRCGREITEINCAVSTVEEDETHVYFRRKKYNLSGKLFCIDCGIDKLEEVLILKKLSNERKCELCLERFRAIKKDRTYRR